jgi:dihydropteroate synthase
MAVLNVTPDSFSDGGKYLDLDAAVARASQQATGGADIIDVGGESTRPGAQRVAVEEELRRVVPVVEQLSSAGILVSIDTMRTEVAAAAVSAGAVMVNDVSGGLADPAMMPFLAEASVPCVLMHWRGHSVDMQTRSHYANGVVKDVVAELRLRLSAAEDAGIDETRIVLDPGLGFAKDTQHNWELLTHLDQISALGRPVLVGASRKRFLGELLASPEGPPDPPLRDDATVAVTALSAATGAWCVRVHDVRGNNDAVLVALAWRRALQ